MAQQFSYDEVKAKDSTGFKIIASIVYAKAKELAADCPIADYKVSVPTSPYYILLLHWVSLLHLFLPSLSLVLLGTSSFIPPSHSGGES